MDVDVVAVGGPDDFVILRYLVALELTGKVLCAAFRNLEASLRSTEMPPVSIR